MGDKPYTNLTGISLPLALWLVSDEYDFKPNGAQISVTALLKSTRQILLRERLDEEEKVTNDIADFIASRLGHAIHDSVEKAWKHEKLSQRLQLLGYPKKLTDNVVINPEGEVPEGKFPVYLEQRYSRKIDGYTISGKFDMVIDGEVNDFKSTSAWAMVKGSKDHDYIMQGSLYRWISPDRVTNDTVAIQFVFTDWQRAMALSNPDYPQTRVAEHRLKLKSIGETEKWLRAKFRELEKYSDAAEPDIPFCTDEELWRQPDKFKYYTDPVKAAAGGRATKNFDDLGEAQAYRATKNKGVVITVPGQVKACAYCPVFNICSQKDLYDHG